MLTCVLDTQSTKTYRETKPSFDVTNWQSNHEYNEGCTNETNVNSTIHHDKAQNVCQLCFLRRLSQVWVPASTLRQPCCPQSILFMLTALHHKHPTDWRQCWLKALWVELTPCCFLYLGENVLANKPPPPFLEAQKLLINSPQTKARTSTSTWLCPNSLWGNIDQPSGTLSLRRLVEKYIFRGTFDWIVCGVVCGAGDGIIMRARGPGLST